MEDHIAPAYPACTCPFLPKFNPKLLLLPTVMNYTWLWDYQLKNPSSHNHGSTKLVPVILGSFHLGWFSTSMIMGGRVIQSTVSFSVLTSFEISVFKWPVPELIIATPKGPTAQQVPRQSRVRCLINGGGQQKNNRKKKKQRFIVGFRIVYHQIVAIYQPHSTTKRKSRFVWLHDSQLLMSFSVWWKFCFVTIGANHFLCLAPFHPFEAMPKHTLKTQRIKLEDIGPTSWYSKQTWYNIVNHEILFQHLL